MPQAQQQSVQQQNGSQLGQASLSMQQPAGFPGSETRKRKAVDDDSDLFSLLPAHAPASSGIPQQASLIKTALSDTSDHCFLCTPSASATGSWCTCILSCGYL